MKFFNSIVVVLVILLQRLSCEEPRIVLVTGGAGYIGSHTCKALREAGFIPVTYDSLALGTADAVKWGPLIIGDLLDTKTLENAFAEYRPFAVIHFAGLRNVRESLKQPAHYYTNNVACSINLLNAMLKHEVKHIIFSSSCTVYGNSLISPIPETHVKMPINPYATSKYMVENIIKDYAHAYPLKYIILRYFNATGIDIEAGLRRSVHSFNFLIPQAMLALLYPKAPLQIFGANFPTPDGTAIRDYIHVKDLADAHVRSLQYLQESGESDEFNLGTSKGYSVLEVLHAIEKVTGKEVPYEFKPCVEGELSGTVAETTKVKEMLHFQPRFSDLQTIIESEWASMQETNQRS